VTAVLLEITSDMTQQGDVAHASNTEEKEGTRANDNGEEGSDQQGVSCEGVAKVSHRIVPIHFLVLSGEDDGVKCESIDSLAWSITEDHPLPTCAAVRIGCGVGG